jgi:hypothetical protein
LQLLLFAAPFHVQLVARSAWTERSALKGTQKKVKVEEADGFDHSNPVASWAVLAGLTGVRLRLGRQLQCEVQVQERERWGFIGVINKEAGKGVVKIRRPTKHVLKAEAEPPLELHDRTRLKVKCFWLVVDRVGRIKCTRNKYQTVVLFHTLPLAWRTRHTQIKNESTEDERYA